MALLNLTLPVIGQSSATEDQKVRDALVAIQAQINGGLDSANIAATYVPTAVGSFSVYRAAAQSLGTGATVNFDTEEFDNSGWHNGAGIYTPQVAGSYRLSWYVTTTGLTVDNYIAAHLYKNGAAHKNGTFAPNRGTSAAASMGTAVVQANGTTDSFDVRVTHNQGGALALTVGAAVAYFGGEMIGR